MRHLRSTTAVVVAATVILAGWSQAGFIALSAQDAGRPKLKVILLGTGGGPRVDMQRFGIRTLVEAGDTRLLFDCGRASTLRMAQMGIPLNSVSKLFLTHLHSDHIIGIPDLFLTPWAATGRRAPFEVWGPDGTTAMMDALQQAFSVDIHTRRDVDEKFPGDGIRVQSHDIREGIVFDQNGVKVTAFLVDHGPVAPAYGFRVDYDGRSVALSGDTTVSENLMRVTKGVDVLVHEAIDPETFRAGAAARNQTTAEVDSIIAHHTTPEQAAEVFSRVRPRLAVFSHAGNSETLTDRTKARYSGRVEAGEDMMTIEIADAVSVRRFAK